MSKYKLLSLFYETPSSWGDRQNIPCSAFAKGPRFLNMVMTFILHPLSHYNTITEPRARFLLSFFEDISIDYPSHFILSLIDVYKDVATCDKLIFPSAIMRLLRHFFVSFPKSPHFLVMCAIDVDTIRRSKAQLRTRWPHPPTLLRLLWVEWHLRPSWHSLCARMLTLTLSMMSYVRWTPVLVISHNNRLSWVVSLLLLLHLH